MRNPVFVSAIEGMTHRVCDGTAWLGATLFLLMIVLSPAGAAQIAAGGGQMVQADSSHPPLPPASRTTDEYYSYLPSIYSPMEIVDQGDIWDVPEGFASTTVEEGMVHRWRIELFADEVVGITAIAAAPADIVLSLMHNGQPIIDRQNDSLAGEAEVMLLPEVTTNSIYEVLIETADRSAAEYAVAPFLPGMFEIEFKGVLTAGEPQQEVHVPLESTHFWFFTADAGDLLTMELTPDEQSDIVGEIFAPGAMFLEIVDFGYGGESEQIANLPLPENGLYAIRVYDIEFHDSGMIYDIVVDWGP